MLRRITAIALLAIAALTAPAAYVQAQTSMARHCDSKGEATAPAHGAHGGMHHPAPAPESSNCRHCTTTDCLLSNHCASGASGDVVTIEAEGAASSPAPSTQHPAPGFTSRTTAPPTPPPNSSPIAS